ncbi:MAG TPA: tetratricopeptide repeat protein, partial [Pirellulales bacterium]|nr:tetratricopeptide repeat protein [Pirellulales bacterium]
KPSTKLSSSDALPTLSANRGTEPAKLTKLVRGELDWIVMKALEKDRSRRYETANGFAMDVQRYLADEPVQACPPSAGYRLRKFARRNKGGLAVAALVLFFLVLLGSGVGWVARDRSAREAEAARQHEARQAKVAGEVESIFGEVDRLEKEQKWPEALEAARRAESAAAVGEAGPATAEGVHQRLKDLEFIDRLERIRMEEATLVEGRFDNAGTDRDYARAFRNYGVDVDELRVETSIDRLKARPALAVVLAAALDDWVFARRKVAEADVARWQRLVAVARGIDPEPLRDLIRAALGQPVANVRHDVLRLADSIDVRAQHPATLVILAHSLRQIQHTDSAIRILRDAQYVHPGDFWLNFELGHVLYVQSDHEGAVRFYTAAVAIQPSFAGTHNNLGKALAAENNLDEAIACCKKAIELDPKFVIAHYDLGNVLKAKGDLDGAELAYREAARLDGKHHGAAIDALAELLLSRGNLKEAIAEWKKVIERDPKDASAHYHLGIALQAKGDLDEAIAEWKEAIAEWKKVIERDPKDAWAHYHLGIVLRAKGYLDEAIAEWKKAIELDPKNAFAHYDLGNVLKAKGDLDGAELAYREAARLDGK